MNIAIVDDNKNDIQKLQDDIKIFFEGSLENISCQIFMNGESFLSSQIEKMVDVIFLDIYMNQLTGIDVARQVKEINPKCLIVFVSTSNSFAAESYEVGALQYLVKPYKYEKFACIMRLIYEKVKKNACYFDLKLKNEIKRVVVSKILYVDYDNHYIQIHTCDEMVKSYTIAFSEVSSTLLRYSNFICCYRNILINMDNVEKIVDKCFLMPNGEMIPISRDKVKEIKQVYHTYLFQKIEGGE